jgi:hypothetical protein
MTRERNLIQVGEISHVKSLPKTSILLLKTAYPWDGPRE